MANIDTFDDFPKPRNAPRLYADVDSIPHVLPLPSPLRHKPTEAQRNRLARDLAIYLVIEGGMSFRSAGRAFKLTQEGIRKTYLKMVCHRIRV